MSVIDTKVCKKCGIEKELKEFEKAKNCKDGRSGSCKVCRKNKRMIEKKCQSCNKIFSTAERNQKFCSYNCFGMSVKQAVKCNCDYCKKEIEVKKCLYEAYNYHYCDMDCKAKHLSKIILGDKNPNYNSVEYNCDGCGENLCMKNSISLVPDVVLKKAITLMHITWIVGISSKMIDITQKMESFYANNATGNIIIIVAMVITQGKNLKAGY